MPDHTQHINELLLRIPEKPGIYQYFDEKGTIIYVGKAKNLKRRVLSYFNKSHDDSPKTRILVRKIRDIKYVVVESETDAFLLENNLIKKHQPRYNILLKDDKTYPSICIKKENFPRVFMTRKMLKDGSEYFGPYSSVPMVHAILDLVKKVYPIRSCKLALQEKDIENGKFRVCLDYHIKKCLGPCQALQSKENYDENIRHIRAILKGDLQEVEDLLVKQIREAAGKLAFEEAQQLKEKLDLIAQYRAKSYIVNSNIRRIDVFSFDESEHSAFINYLNVVKGCIVQAYTIEYKKRIEEEKEDVLASGIYELRQRFHSHSDEIIVPFLPNLQLENVSISVPQRGDKKKLLELSEKNVRQYKLDLLKQEEKLNPEQRATRILNRLKSDLQMKELPIHIECFDNSNIQGSYPVSSCVVFKMAKASKKDYRHFGIKSVVGANDFASMEEVLSRRYSALLKEGQALPQLIIVDGGKGQLSSAVHAMKMLPFNEDFPIEEREEIQRKIEAIQLIGIAKNLEEIFFPNDSIPLYLDKNSESLRLIQQLRDEAHRFGITYHRKLRSKAQTQSELDEIPQIGEQSKQKLLREFKSVKRIKEATFEALEEVVGKSKAGKIQTFFAKKEENRFLSPANEK